MNKRETARRLAKARMGIVDVTPIGTVFAKRFIAKRHGNVHLPHDDIFAFVANGDAPSETHVIVAERHERLEIVGCACKGDLQMSDEWFDNLLTTTLAEASECQVKPPMSITFANEHGVFAFSFNNKAKRRAA